MFNETTFNIFHNNIWKMLFIKTKPIASCPEILLNVILCFTSGYIMCHYWHCCKKLCGFFCCWHNSFILYSDTSGTMTHRYLSNAGHTGTSNLTRFLFFKSKNFRCQHMKWIVCFVFAFLGDEGSTVLEKKINEKRWIIVKWDLLL